MTDPGAVGAISSEAESRLANVAAASAPPFRERDRTYLRALMVAILCSLRSSCEISSYGSLRRTFHPWNTGWSCFDSWPDRPDLQLMKFLSGRWPLRKDVMLSWKGWKNTMPYLESAVPTAFEKAIYGDPRKSREGFQEYIIRMDAAFKELHDEGVALGDVVKGYVLFRSLWPGLWEASNVDKSSRLWSAGESSQRSRFQELSHWGVWRHPWLLCGWWWPELCVDWVGRLGWDLSWRRLPRIKKFAEPFESRKRIAVGGTQLQRSFLVLPGIAVIRELVECTSTCWSWEPSVQDVARWDIGLRNALVNPTATPRARL